MRGLTVPVGHKKRIVEIRSRPPGLGRPDERLPVMSARSPLLTGGHPRRQSIAYGIVALAVSTLPVPSSMAADSVADADIASPGPVDACQPRFTGGPDGDEVQGNRSDNRICGRSGNDRLSGQRGNDILRGQVGLDYLQGGLGDDFLSGGDWSDILFTDVGDYLGLVGGNDHAHGGGGNDALYGEGGADHLEGGAGKDVLYGGYGDDFMDGGQGPDTFRGGDGDDVEIGGRHNDTFFSTPGFDQIWGGPGNDIIHLDDGVAANDSAICGDGDDIAYIDAGDTVDADCETVVEADERGPEVAPTASRHLRGFRRALDMPMAPPVGGEWGVVAIARVDGW
jgi:Ca2+-binding RTX toxin-like protein